MARRNYSDEQKAMILAAYEANGGRLRKTARDFGVPVRTLQHWLQGEGLTDGCSKLATLKKRDLAQWFEDLVAELIDAAPDKIAKAGLKDVAVALGVATDKMQLLRGKPTAIQENVEQKREALLKRATELAERHGTDKDAALEAMLEARPELRQWLQ